MLRTIKLLLIYFAVQFAFAGFFTVGYMLVKGLKDVPSAEDGTFVMLSITAQVVATLAMGCYLHFSGDARLDRKTLALGSWKISAVSALLIIGMGCWTNYINEALELPNNLEQMFDVMMHNPLGIISIVILAPVIEEMFFREGIQGHLQRTWKPVWAIIVSSLIFGLVHGNPVQIPFAFVTGLALGWVYYCTGSLWPSILMHFINNASSVLLYHLSENPGATMRETLGESGALVTAVAGAVITIFSILLLKKLTNKICHETTES